MEAQLVITTPKTLNFVTFLIFQVFTKRGNYPTTAEKKQQVHVRVALFSAASTSKHCNQMTVGNKCNLCVERAARATRAIAVTHRKL